MAWTAGSTAAGTATTTSPAPTREAARVISDGAPVMSLDPATTTTTPEARLCASSARRGITAATSAGSSRTTSSGVVSVAKPMSTTRTVPACSAPGNRTAPSLGAPNVTVTSAHTASPSTVPVAPSTPEGISTATTGTGDAFNARIAAAHPPVGSPWKPGTEQCIDRDIGARELAGQGRGLERCGRQVHFPQPHSVGGRRLAGHIDRLQRDDAHPHPPPSQVPRGDEAVPSVVARAADDHGSTSVHTTTDLHRGLCDGGAGALHQRRGRHA